MTSSVRPVDWFWLGVLVGAVLATSFLVLTGPSRCDNLTCIAEAREGLAEP